MSARPEPAHVSSAGSNHNDTGHSPSAPVAGSANNSTPYGSPESAAPQTCALLEFPPEAISPWSGESDSDGWSTDRWSNDTLDGFPSHRGTTSPPYRDHRPAHRGLGGFHNTARCGRQSSGGRASSPRAPLPSFPRRCPEAITNETLFREYMAQVHRYMYDTATAMRPVLREHLPRDDALDVSFARARQAYDRAKIVAREYYDNKSQRVGNACCAKKEGLPSCRGQWKLWFKQWRAERRVRTEQAAEFWTLKEAWDEVHEVRNQIFLDEQGYNTLW